MVVLLLLFSSPPAWIASSTRLPSLGARGARLQIPIVQLLARAPAITPRLHS
jgi:hypothetical protein